MMEIKLDEIAQDTQNAFTGDSAEANRRGLIHSSYNLGLYQRRRVQQIEQRVEAVLACQKRLISAVRLPFSGTLASELKAQSEEWVTPEWCEQSVQSDPDLGLTKDYKPGFREETLQARNSALKKASIEIDLLVDELRTEGNTQKPTLSKELDQKFKILLSPGQAEKDFADWSQQLSPVNGQIAVLFADLDNFKALNTKYSEPKIDQSLLPDAMHLIEGLTRMRGGAYKHGGDEYVLILPNHDAMEAAGFAEKLRKAIQQFEFKVDTDLVHITVSLGIAVWPVHGAAYQDLLVKASEAKTQAKIQKNCFRMTELVSGPGAPLPRSGVSLSAQHLAVFLNRKSAHGLDYDPMVDPASLYNELGFTDDVLALAADELAEHGWIKLVKTMGMGKAGFSTLSPTALLFIETDRFVRGNDPTSDARELAAQLIKQPEGSANLSELDKQLSWGPRRINPSVSFLQLKEYVQASKTFGAHPYALSWIRATEKTKRFALNA
ncbi:MAG: GGDEF domain-containing protein [Acidobacteriota bacterium]